jgi:hypothetical protein
VALPLTAVPTQIEPSPLSELTLLIAERANRLASQHPARNGDELETWLEAEAQVKRELRERHGPHGAGPRTSE